MNVMRTVRELENAGAAAIQIEDQILPKKCGHLNDKKLASPEEMAAKIAAACRARQHVRIMARTDAVTQEGIDAAIARRAALSEGRRRCDLRRSADIGSDVPPFQRSGGCARCWPI